MSFVKSKELIEPGDLIVIYCGFKNTSIVQVEKNKLTQIKLGAVRHNDLIGTKFGRRYKCSKGTCLILAVTPELWSLNLPHRTQILYALDISMITSLLYLQPGYKVIEAGTGSGSLSHSIIRTIFPTGHLYTFDFHAKRVDIANKEFKAHNLNDYVTCKHRDVCKDGFDLKNVVDAVFLDLPNPWESIPFAYDALKNTGTTRICCFSPCIEQVQKTVEALENCSFIDVQTIEVVSRPHEFKKKHWRSLNLYGNDSEAIAQSDAKDGSNAEEDADNLDAVKMETECLSDSNLLNEGDNDDLKNNECREVGGSISATALNRVPGHTGFLTVATKL